MDDARSLSKPIGSASGESPTMASVRVVVAFVMLVCFSSAPFVSLTRWATDLPLSSTEWPYRLTYGGAAALGTAAFALRFAGRGARQRRSGTSRLGQAAMIALIALAAWTLLSLAWTEAPRSALWEPFITAGLILGAVWFGTAMSGREQIIAVASATQLLTLVSAVLALTREDARDFAGSWNGLFNSPNTLGPMAALAVISVVAVANVWPQRRRSVVATGLVGANIGVLATTSSSTPVAALVVAAVVAGGASGQGRRCRAPTYRPTRYGRYVGVGAVMVTVVAAPWMLWIAADRVTRTLTGRTTIWAFLVEHWGGRHWKGWGLTAFWSDATQVEALHQRLERWFPVYSAHSSFIEVMIGLGIVGLVLVQAVVAFGAGAVCLAVYRSAPLATWSAAVMAFCLVENLTESMIAYHSLFWLLLLAGGLGHRADMARWTSR